MKNDRRTALLWGAVLPVSVLGARAARAAAPPAVASAHAPSTSPLNRYVGSWRGDVTVEGSMPEPQRYVQENTFGWALGGRFLEERGTGSNGSSFIGLWSHDAASGKYRAHYFLAPEGNVVALVHEWDERRQSFSGAADLGGGVRMLAEDRFTGPDAYQWTITVQDMKGAMLTRMIGRERRVRR
jgi:hypothetical protein